MKTCWFIVIESMGAWWVDCEGKAYGPFASDDEARSEACRIASVYGDSGRMSQVYAADQHGTQQLIWSGVPGRK